MQILIVKSGPNTSLYELFTTSRGILECEALDVAGLFPGVNLSNGLWADKNTTTPPASQQGNIETPFATIAALAGAIVGAAVPQTLFVMGADYSAEALANLPATLVTFNGFGPVLLPALNSAGDLALNNVGVAVSITAVGQVVLTNAAAAPLTTAAGLRRCINSTVYDVTVTAALGIIELDDCQLAGAAIQSAGVAMRCTSSRILGANVFTFTGAPGVLTLDASTYAEYLASGSSLVNGTLLVQGGQANLPNVLYSAVGTTVPPAEQTGNIEAPFSTLAAALAATPVSGIVVAGPGDYSPEGGLVALGSLELQGFSQGMWASAVIPTNLATLTMPAASTLSLLNFFASVVTIPNTSFFAATNDSIAAILGDGTIELKDSEVAGQILCNDFVADGSTINSGANPFQITGTRCQLTNCDIGTFFGAVTITFTGAPGTVSMDAQTYRSFVASASTVVNGSIALLGRALTATISVAVPAIVAAGVDYFDVSTVGTALEGIPANTPITANPTADLAVAGAGAGGFLNARVSAASTIRCTFYGVLAGGASDFVFSTVNGW